MLENLSGKIIDNIQKTIKLDINCTKILDLNFMQAQDKKQYVLLK